MLATFESTTSAAAVHGLSAIPRHGGNGSPWIWNEDADREAVRAWDAAGRPANKKPKGMGAFYSRTTTFIDALSDKSALTDWKIRKVLEGIHLRPNLLDDMPPELDSPEGKKSAKDVAEKALEVAGAGFKAKLGSGIHEITEDIDNGKDPGFIPEQYEADIEAYKEATENIQMLGVELFGVHDGYKVAGTMDRVGILPRGWCHDVGIDPDTPVVLDVKTGGIDFDRGKIAMQMAFYARMNGYDPHTFERTPLLRDRPSPSKDVAVIIHLPAEEGFCNIVPVDIRSAWESVALVDQVRKHRSLWNRKESKMEPLLTVSKFYMK